MSGSAFTRHNSESLRKAGDARHRFFRSLDLDEARAKRRAARKQLQIASAKAGEGSTYERDDKKIVMRQQITKANKCAGKVSLAPLKFVERA